MTWEIAVDPDPAPPNGVVIDGVVYPLEDQPPIAKGGAWWRPTPTDPE